MANGGNEEILERLSALQRDMRELLVLVKKLEGRAAHGGADSVSEEQFFDAEGGE